MSDESDKKMEEFILKYDYENIMEIWFKQFESNGKQVLVKKDASDEDDKIGITIEWKEDIGSLESSIWFKYNDDNYEEIEKIRDERFDKITQSNVDSAIKEVQKAIGLEE